MQKVEGKGRYLIHRACVCILCVFADIPGALSTPPALPHSRSFIIRTLGLHNALSMTMQPPIHNACATFVSPGLVSSVDVFPGGFAAY